MSLLSISLRDGDWVKLRQILQHISHLQLGVNSTPTFAGLTLNELTLSKTCEVAAGLNVLRVTGLQVDGTAMTGTLRGAYIDVSNGSTAATGTIRAMELKARTEAPGDSGSNVTVLEGLSISADSKDHSVTTMRAAEFILDGSTGGTITEAVGLRIANNLQANKATTSYGLQIYRDSFDYTADIQLSGGGTIGGSSGVMQLSSAGLLEIADVTATGTGTFAYAIIENTTLPAGTSRALKINHRKATAGGTLYGIDVDVRHDVSGSSSRVVPLNLAARISDGTFADSQKLLDFYGAISGGSFTSIRGIQNQAVVSGSPTLSVDLVGAWNDLTVAATVTVGGDIIGQYLNVTNSGATVTGDVYALKLDGSGVDWGIWDGSGGDWALDGDNQKLFFGEGQDASIYYDATDLIIDTDVVGSGSCKINGLEIDNNGILTATRVANFQSNIAADGYMTAIFGADVNANTLTDNTRKFCRIGIPHYDIDEQPTAMFFGDNNVAYNYLFVGGGNAGMNAVTHIKMYTAADTTTTTGTLRIEIDSSGNTKIGDGTNESQFAADGDLTFIGTAGLPFGSCYGNHIGWSQASAVQNTWYNISDADMADGNLNNVTHDGNGKLTVASAGMYFVSYSCCFEDNVANDHIEIGIEVSGSGSANDAGQVHLENKFASEEEHSSSSAILDLAASATLEIAIRTTDIGTPTISVQAVNLTCIQIGGT